MKKLTNGDIGGGGGLRFGIFVVTSFLNGPLCHIHQAQQISACSRLNVIKVDRYYLFIIYF